MCKERIKSAHREHLESESRAESESQVHLERIQSEWRPIDDRIETYSRANDDDSRPSRDRIESETEKESERLKIESRANRE